MMKDEQQQKVEGGRGIWRPCSRANGLPAAFLLQLRVHRTNVALRSVIQPRGHEGGRGGNTIAGGGCRARADSRLVGRVTAL